MLSIPPLESENMAVGLHTHGVTILMVRKRHVSGLVHMFTRILKQSLKTKTEMNRKQIVYCGCWVGYRKYYNNYYLSAYN